MKVCRVLHEILMQHLKKQFKNQYLDVTENVPMFVMESDLLIFK